MPNAKLLERVKTGAVRPIIGLTAGGWNNNDLSILASAQFNEAVQNVWPQSTSASDDQGSMFGALYQRRGVQGVGNEQYRHQRGDLGKGACIEAVNVSH